jgi:hypothetical protein
VDIKRLIINFFIIFFVLLSFSCSLCCAANFPELIYICRNYDSFQNHKALVIAFEPSTEKWAAGIVGSKNSPEAALDLAKTICEESRKRQDINTRCEVFAIDDKYLINQFDWRSVFYKGVNAPNCSLPEKDRYFPNPSGKAYIYFYKTEYSTDVAFEENIRNCSMH